MHQIVLVFTELMNDETPKTYSELAQEAIGDAEMYLDVHVGVKIDYYDTHAESCKTFLTTKSGEKCQACRITDFKEFTDGLPGDLIRGGYIDSFMLDKYGVDWSVVIERELKEAAEQDSPSYQSWIVAVDVHI